jgi:uncharacterized damage-inducible protein DinB
MTERERLIDQFEREIAGQPWHGPSLTAILEGVTAAEAANKPSPGTHSMWEILLHMTGWKREVTRRMQGHRAGEPPEGDWPAIGDASEARWEAAKADHLAAQRELLDLVRGMTEENLGTKVAGEATASIGAGLSLKATLYGLLQHDVYHAGQIALLKRMAGGAIRYGV